MRRGLADAHHHVGGGDQGRGVVVVPVLHDRGEPLEPLRPELLLDLAGDGEHVVVVERDVERLGVAHQALDLRQADGAVGARGLHHPAPAGEPDDRPALRDALQRGAVARHLGRVRPVGRAALGPRRLERVEVAPVVAAHVADRHLVLGDHRVLDRPDDPLFLAGRVQRQPGVGVAVQALQPRVALEDHLEVLAQVGDDRAEHQLVADALLAPEDELRLLAGRAGGLQRRRGEQRRVGRVGVAVLAQRPLVGDALPVQVEALAEAPRFEVQQAAVPDRAALAADLHRLFEVRDALLGAALVHEQRAHVDERRGVVGLAVEAGEQHLQALLVHVHAPVAGAQIRVDVVGVVEVERLVERLGRERAVPALELQAAGVEPES